MKSSNYRLCKMVPSILFATLVGLSSESLIALELSANTKSQVAYGDGNDLIFANGFEVPPPPIAPIELSDIAAGTGGFVINGIDRNDYSGYSVSYAGDVNGDGLADVIVGARFADPVGSPAAGETYVVFGKANTSAVDLFDVASGIGGFVINGVNTADDSGLSVSNAGDVNGDGLADVIVASPGADPGGDYFAGESYVVFGKTSTTAVDLSDLYQGGGGFVIVGIDANDNSSWSVSSAGDVNGDGLADVIVGAFGADPGGKSYAGESYVVFGKTNTAPVDLADVVAGIGGFVINGIDAGDASGESVSAAGDVNGDGLSDLIVGAPNAGVSNAGQSYVVFGKASTASVDLIDVEAGVGGFVINGIDAEDRCCVPVSAAGDVNGDGLADVIVGAFLADVSGVSNAGESYVVFGKATTDQVDLSDVAAGASAGGFVINGIDADDASSYSVSAAGDQNGDGLADVIVGAFKADPGGNSTAGESYVVFGKTNNSTVELSNVAAGLGGFVINGIDAGDHSGHSVSSAGDVNGDGLVDLIIGAPVADHEGIVSAGESYVVFGR